MHTCHTKHMKNGLSMVDQLYTTNSKSGTQERGEVSTWETRTPDPGSPLPSLLPSSTKLFVVTWSQTYAAAATCSRRVCTDFLIVPPSKLRYF